MRRLSSCLALTFALLTVSPAFADCAAVKGLHEDGMTINVAEVVTTGGVKLPYASSYGTPIAGLPAFCRVAGVLRPTPDSNIKFEVWMPVAAWGQRLLVGGNGGFAGTINYDEMAAGLKQGYATASTDTGHEAQAEDASWAYRHREKVVDYGYRGLHVTTVAAKKIVAAMYGKPAGHSYFDGCSNGGREALMEAQRFPDDFDGILAGAPANNWTMMLSSGIDAGQTMLLNPASYISSLKIPAITRAALEACDALDGVKDGIVSQPARCHFDPEVLLCKGEDALTCLTAPQVGVLKKLYRGGVGKDGKLLFPGFVPGGENPGWASWVLGPGPDGASGPHYAENYFRYMVTSDPKWSLLDADPATALPMAREATGHELDAIDPDLKPFLAHGKLILYHGWNDAAISPWNTVNYWKSVRETIGAETQDASARLYMVPGMEHCAGGVGPNAFGQLMLPAGNGAGTGALDALEAWVEKGTVPGPIVATKYAGKTAAISRPLCPYPASGVYDGKGDPNVVASFACKVE